MTKWLRSSTHRIPTYVAFVQWSPSAAETGRISGKDLGNYTYKTTAFVVTRGHPSVISSSTPSFVWGSPASVAALGCIREESCR